MININKTGKYNNDKKKLIDIYNLKTRLKVTRKKEYRLIRKKKN